MKAYEARCIKKLKELGAPLEGWECLRTWDSGDAAETCELCGFPTVRYVHEMAHPEYPDKLSVGCLCDGVMTGDELAAKERERQVKNRTKRWENFYKKVKERRWTRVRPGLVQLRYKGKSYAIEKTPRGYVPGRFSRRTNGIYQTQPAVRTPKEALKAVFELVEADHEKTEDTNHA